MIRKKLFELAAILESFDHVGDDIGWIAEFGDNKTVESLYTVLRDFFKEKK